MPGPRIEPRTPACQADVITTTLVYHASHSGKTMKNISHMMVTLPSMYLASVQRVVGCSRHMTDNREDLGSNSAGVPQNFGKFVYSTLPVFFRRDTKWGWSILFGVYARRSKNSQR